MTYDDLDQVDYGDVMSSGKSSPGLPQEGLIVKGIVLSVDGSQATVKVPGYLDGILIHWEGVKPNATVFAKVVHVSNDSYFLDTSYVNQRNGIDEDPDNERRAPAPIQPDGVAENQSGPALPKVNHVYSAVIKNAKAGVGAFVEIEQFKPVNGLIPFGKLTGGAGVADPVFVKVVQVIHDKGQFNCDMRYVDQVSGIDLDPTHSHSNEKVKATGQLLTQVRGGTKEPHQENESGVNRSIQDDRRSHSPIVRRARARRRSPSDSPIKRRRFANTRRTEPSPDVIRRRR